MKAKKDICRELGHRLRILRQDKGLTQEKMAELAGINWRYYAEAERGQRNISIGSLQKIADGLEVTLEDIFRFQSERQLTEDEGKIIALVTRVLAKGTKKIKRRVAIILQEIVD